MNVTVHRALVLCQSLEREKIRTSVSRLPERYDVTM